MLKETQTRKRKKNADADAKMKQNANASLPEFVLYVNANTKETGNANTMQIQAGIQPRLLTRKQMQTRMQAQA